MIEIFRVLWCTECPHSLCSCSVTLYVHVHVSLHVHVLLINVTHFTGAMSDLQLKREPTPPDIKVQRSSSNAGTVIKRNKGLNGN